MTGKWQLQAGKARFSELIQRAKSEGPQIVTVRGVDAAVVMSIEDFRRYKAAEPNFVEYLLSGPKLGDDVVDAICARSPDPGRDVDL